MSLHDGPDELVAEQTDIMPEINAVLAKEMELIKHDEAESFLCVAGKEGSTQITVHV